MKVTKDVTCLWITKNTATAIWGKSACWGWLGSALLLIFKVVICTIQDHLTVYFFTFRLHNAHYCGVCALHVPLITCPSNSTSTTITSLSLVFCVADLWVFVRGAFFCWMKLSCSFFSLYFKQIWKTKHSLDICCWSTVRKFGLCDEIVKSLKYLNLSLMKASWK